MVFRDLPIDNIGKIRKIYLMHMLESVVITIKLRRQHKKFFVSFSDLMIKQIHEKSKIQLQASDEY